MATYDEDEFEGETLEDFITDFGYRDEEAVVYNLNVEIAAAVTSLDRTRLFTALNFSETDAISSTELLSSEGIHPGMYCIGNHSKLATPAGNQILGSATAITIDEAQRELPPGASRTAASELWSGEASVSESVSQRLLQTLLAKEVLIKNDAEPVKMEGVRFALCYQNNNSAKEGSVAGMSLLHHACLHQDQHALGTLIGLVREANKELDARRDRGDVGVPEDITVDARDLNNATPLHYAAALPGPVGESFVYALLDAKAGIDERDGYKATPLHWAARADNVGVVKLLLGKKADAATEMTVELVDDTAKRDYEAGVRPAAFREGTYPHELTNDENIRLMLLDDCEAVLERRRREAEIRRQKMDEAARQKAAERSDESSDAGDEARDEAPDEAGDHASGATSAAPKDGTA